MSINIFSERTAKRLSWIGLLSILVGVFVFIYFRSWDFSWMIDEEKVAQFGDFIGGVVGTILAFVGVILYYLALTEQRNDIKINRDALETQVKTLNQQIIEFKAQTSEMQETRTAYEKQTSVFQEQTILFQEQTNFYKKQTEYYEQQVKELENQTKMSSLQRFNSEFYSLLNVFIGIKNDCKESINMILKGLERNAPDVYNKTSSVSERHLSFVEEFTKLYYQNANSLSRYFKTLSRLLKLIDDSIIELKDKERYAKTLRSQLSEKELLVTYYDFCSKLGDNTKILAIKYDLLKHLHLMDKLENETRKVFNPHRASVFFYFSQLSKLLSLKIKELNDYENEKDIDVQEDYTFVGMESTYHLIMTDKLFSFDIEFPKKQELFNTEDLKKLFLVFLYDFFFLSKLREPIDGQFRYSESQTEKTILFNFTSTTNIDKLFKYGYN